ATGAEIAVLEDGFINIYPDMTDVESPPRFVILAGPKHGMLDTPSGNHPYWPNVGFGYLPDANYYGDDSIVFEARDSVSASGPATTDEAGAVCVPNWAKNLSAGPNESAQILSIAVSSFDHALLATATIDLAG